MDKLKFGHLGNGITVWDKNGEIVAHIDIQRCVHTKRYLRIDQIIEIMKYAIFEDPNISVSQEQKVFNERPKYHGVHFLQKP